jgi:multisubunit Na+/H+ antiporter MnhF subunit
VNVWLIGATVLLGGFLPCLWVATRARAIAGLVAVQAAGSTGTVVLLLLAQGYHRSDYFVLPLALAVLSVVGTLAFARFLGKGIE